ncbi:MAG: Slp family lipoprotein [Candidatus Tectomicrobia bacterium]|nr:Slp family lipoprotein [Candidatus Tectomicrobia bacterium]
MRTPRGLGVFASASRFYRFVCRITGTPAYTDRIVMVGGTIVSTDPVEQGTLVTVVQHLLEHHERPRLMDATAGRFMTAALWMVLGPFVRDGQAHASR